MKTNSENSNIDWDRLEKALLVEAQRGFTNLKGNQYHFGEFLCLTFGQPSPLSNPNYRHRWQEMAIKFASYPHISSEERRDLVAEANQLIGDFKLSLAQKDITKNNSQNVESKTLKTQLPTRGKNRKVSLDCPLHELVEVGRAKSGLLEKLGLYKVRDLLFHYPRDYIDYSRQVNISNLMAGETVTLVGSIKKCNCFNSAKNKKITILDLVITDRTGQIKISRFFAGTRFANRGWQEMMKRQYPLGAIVAASGLIKQNKYGLTLDNPEIEILDSSGNSISSLKIGRILPVYPLTEGVPADLVRRAAVEALQAMEQVRDPLPTGLRNQYGLIGLQEAIAHIHYPPDQTALTHARRRLVFDEFFYLQLGFLQRRQQQKTTEKSAIFAPQGKIIENFNQLLPFSLTKAQKKVIGEILQDLESPTPMNRLVQGDVGSGKTIVGVFAILAAIQSGYQAALMAPTEVLAEQHYRKLVSWFNLLHLPVELLTGSTKTAKRRQVLAQLETGELPLLVGTHALIQDPVNFQRLGLVVIDEQHRFGVQQRARLLSKGQAPHVLTMTATPIPRTLALTLHGDLDVSQIDELPPGRQPIKTTVLTGRQRIEAYDLIKREVVQGRQAYVIFPLIEESEKLDVRAAVEEYHHLSNKVFPEFNIGLLHGRMSSVEKDQVLNAFRDNEIQIIVSTTVIEVGVDVPNATVMLIENAERFGLSQLHQLRGRVGRGQHKSYCVLMIGNKTADAVARLGVLEQSQDGFFISEMDLRFRGPGQVLGTRQSGLPDFALASLVEDQEVLVLAREAAEKIMLADSTLKDIPSLRQELELRYQRLLGGDILT
jgi:ATP-dependent DNA helicase RecG